MKELIITSSGYSGVQHPDDASPLIIATGFQGPAGPQGIQGIPGPVNIGTTVGNGGTLNSVLYVGASNRLAQDLTNFVYDESVHRLRVSGGIDIGSDSAYHRFSGSPSAARTLTMPDVSGMLITTGNLSAITWTGTITSGTWQGSVIGSAYGGAGSVSGILKADGAGTVSAAVVGTDYQAAGNYLTALTGDVTAAGPGSVAATVARIQGRNVGNIAPTDQQALRWNNALSQWEPQTIIGMGIGNQITGASPGSVLFAGAGGVLAEDNAAFFWDATNKRLGLGTTTPLARLHSVAPASNVIGAIVQGAASQSTNLTEWRNSAGVALSVVDASGKLGIGTSSPSNSLHVRGGDGQGLLISNSNDAVNYFVSLSTQWDPVQSVIFAGSAGTIWSARYDGQGIFLLPTANTGSGVGIGTTTPRSLEADSLFTVQLNTSSGFRSAFINSGLGSSGIVIRRSGGIVSRWDLYTPANLYEFRISNGTTDWLTIQNGGNVGINTTSPSAQLHVVASASNVIGQIVKGAASQSSDLMQWQNSSGVALSVVKADGSVGIGTSATVSKLSTAGSADFSSSASNFRHYHSVYQANHSQLTGTMVITAPVGWSSTMLHITINGYDYSGSTGAWQVIVGGYNFSSGFWTNANARLIGSPPFSTVRLGYNGSKVVILLGNITTSWSNQGLTRVEVSDVIATHSGVDLWGGGWSSTITTSEAAYSNILTPNLTKDGAVYQAALPTALPATDDSTNNFAVVRGGNIGLQYGVLNLSSAYQGYIQAGNYTFGGVYYPFLINPSGGNVGINTTSPGAQLQVNASASNVIGQIVKGAVSQSSDLMQWQNSSGVALAAVLSNGAIKPASMTDAAAANDSIYYSTTQNKLVYKDSSAVVQVLY